MPPQTAASLTIAFLGSAGRDNNLVQNSNVHFERTRIPARSKRRPPPLSLNPAEAVCFVYIESAALAYVISLRLPPVYSRDVCFNATCRFCPLPADSGLFPRLDFLLFHLSPSSYHIPATGLPETPTRATSGMKVGEHAGQTHHAMDALLTKELKDFRLKTPLESFSSLLGYPREGVAKHKDTVALASLPAITGAYHSLKKAADSCKTEHQLYQPLSNLLNAICEAPLLSSTPLRRGSPSRSPSPPLSPASSTSSPEDDLGLSFIVSAHAKITEKKVPRTPDLAMIIHHGDSPSDVPSYADILIPIEVKGPNNSEDVEHQVADQARAVLAAQCDRNFALCLSITFMAKTRFLECRLWYFDRSGSISSEGFNIFRERRPFIWLVRRLTDLIDPEMGFDQTLKHLGPPVGPESHQEFVTTIMDEKMGPVEVTTDRVLWNTRSIRGRATRCFGAIVGSAPCILKLAWQDPARRPKEVKFYQWIEEYNIDAGVAHYLAYDEGIRTSELRRGVGGRSGDNYVFEDRVLCRLVLSTVGRSLEDYATLKELFGAIHDCITGASFLSLSLYLTH
jgi:hypothetical protein